MLKRRAVIVALVCQLPLAALAAPLQFSFAAPTGWQIREDSVREYYYWLARVGDTQRRCSLRVEAEGVQTVEESQTQKSIRFREFLSGPVQPVIHRSKLHSKSGELILKADVLWAPVTHPQVPAGFFRSVIYSFCGRDRRIYTFRCYPPTREGAFFDRALDDLARTIRL